MAETKYKLTSAAWSAIKINLAIADPQINRSEYNIEAKKKWFFFTSHYELTTNNDKVKQLIQQQEHKLLAGEPYNSKVASRVSMPSKKDKTFKMDMGAVLVSTLRQDLKKSGFWENDDYVFAKSNGETVSPFIHDSDQEQSQVDRIIVKNPKLMELLEQPGNKTRFLPQQTAQLEPQQKGREKAKMA